MKKHTVRTIRKMKADQQRIVMITAYDAPTARFAEAGGVDMILVGDSLGMTCLGYTDTVPVTMDDIVHHCRAVRRGAPDTFIAGDMPFLSCHLGIEQALRNAGRLIQEANCDCVKVETDRVTLPVVKALVDAGIPVCAHIGLLPQAVKTSGGYRVQGRTEDDAAEILEIAKAAQEAGAFAAVVECVPRQLAAKITKTLEIPTIGIGAGLDCDGQVQVFGDLNGLLGDFVPKHAKRYAAAGDMMTDAVKQYAADVRGKTFPEPGNGFD